MLEDDVFVDLVITLHQSHTDSAGEETTGLSVYYSADGDKSSVLYFTICDVPHQHPTYVGALGFEFWPCFVKIIFFG